MLPILYIIIPCYNEEAVLPITSKLFLNKLEELIASQMIDEKTHPRIQIRSPNEH